MKPGGEQDQIDAAHGGMLDVMVNIRYSTFVLFTPCPICTYNRLTIPT